MSIPAQIRKVFNNAICLFTKHDIETALDAMAISIHNELSEANPILLTVLKGGVVLMGNLLPRLDFPLELDSVYATRYQGAFEGSKLEWKYEPKTSLQDRTVLIVDDILDLGITLQAIVDYCYKNGAKKVYTAVLLDKKVVKRPAEGLQKADFVALEVDDRFVFGYGLDYKEYLRNAPGIYEVAPEDQN
ncbi:MAG: hpt 1 [Gammaproteobacteria bacterium]|jgi:hypoxanthine phosphoribosyltransferase|nr:hpt 1 [Gammaproteobacteria bacterium]